MAILNSKYVDILVKSTVPTANEANTGFRTIGHATGVSLDYTRENIEVTSKASDSNTERIAGKKDSTGSITGYADLNQATQNFYNASTRAQDQTPTGTDNVPELFQYIDAGTTLYVRMGIGNARFVIPVLGSGLTMETGFDDSPTYTFNWEQAGKLVYDPDVIAS